MSYSILIIRFCGPAQAKRKFWPPETRFVWPCAGKTVRPRSAGAFRCIFCGPAQAKRKFWPPETHLVSSSVDSRGVTTRWTKIATAPQRDAKKISAPPFRAGETQILTSGVAFSVALRSKKRGGQKKTPRPKRLYPYRKNPSVWHTVWGNKCKKMILRTEESLPIQIKGLPFGILTQTHPNSQFCCGAHLATMGHGTRAKGQGNQPVAWWSSTGKVHILQQFENSWWVSRIILSYHYKS